MNTRYIFTDPMDSRNVKRRRVSCGIALGLTAVLSLVGYIGQKQGWLEVKPTRHGGFQYTLVRETEPDTDSFDPTVRFYVIAEEPVAKKCPACGEAISLEAAACPHCGNTEGEFALQLKCPVCGNLYDADDPQCPQCAEK